MLVRLYQYLLLNDHRWHVAPFRAIDNILVVLSYVTVRACNRKSFDFSLIEATAHDAHEGVSTIFRDWLRSIMLMRRFEPFLESGLKPTKPMTSFCLYVS